MWQARNGFFVHAGGNYSPGTQGRVVAGYDIDHSAWGLDLRIGFHPGVTPPRQRVRRIRETTTITNTVTVTPPAPPAPAPNRPPTAGFGATRACWSLARRRNAPPRQRIRKADR